MPQSNHRLVGVLEVLTAWNFEAAAPDLEPSTLRLAFLEDEAFEASWPETALLADVSSLAAELVSEYQKYAGGRRSGELAVL
jgi:hypothetical protein